MRNKRVNLSWIEAQEERTAKARRTGRAFGVLVQTVAWVGLLWYMQAWHEKVPEFVQAVQVSGGVFGLVCIFVSYWWDKLEDRSHKL